MKLLMTDQQSKNLNATLKIQSLVDQYTGSRESTFIKKFEWPDFWTKVEEGMTGQSFPTLRKMTSP